MASKGDNDEFVLLIIGVQTRLYAYVLSLVLNRERATDILQQTNLVMLEKAGDFEPGSNFAAWAYRVAYYEVLADRRKRQREKHLFSDDLLALVATRSSKVGETLDQRSMALEECLDLLPEKHKELIQERYRPEGSVASLAEKLQKSPAAVSAYLYRIRCELLDCTQRKINQVTNV